MAPLAGAIGGLLASGMWVLSTSVAHKHRADRVDLASLVSLSTESAQLTRGE
jgi:hypothetical protein